MAISRIETNSIAPSQTLTTPIIATTMGVGGATPSGSGSGITFPATQSASTDANTLDDYEEGTWTVTDQSGAGLTISNSTTQRYRKVGSLVFIVLYITYPSTANTSEARISLPFQAGGAYCYLSGRYQGAAKSGTTGFIAQVQADLSYAVFQSSTSSTASFNNNELSTSYILLSGCYIAAA